MLYRTMGKTGDKVSILGYGCIRFPREGGNIPISQMFSSRIDEKRTERLIFSAIDHGVNYFDTAYSYIGSEAILGKILAKGYRNKVMIATKIPLFNVRTYEDMEAILDTQLKRLQTEHIDYYLVHGLMSKEEWQRGKLLGIEKFLKKAKSSGKIGHIGFSYHGDRSQFKNIVDDYTWEFCQIQYNYLDENVQAGKEGLMYASSKGLGVVVMQPLRNGVLAGQQGKKMPKQARSLFEQAEVKKTPAEWGLRWVWNHPEVSVALSGMEEVSHIEENIRIANTAYPSSLANDDMKIINEVKEMFNRIIKIRCNSCGYCMPCPAGVNIPLCFQLYNDYHIFGWLYKFVYIFYSTLTSPGGNPIYASRCCNCGKCESHCTQGLPIREYLKEVSKIMEPFYFKPAVRLMRWIKGRQRKPEETKQNLS